MKEADIVVALLGGDSTDEEIQIECDISQEKLEEIMEAHNCEVCPNCQEWCNESDLGNEDGFCNDCQEDY